MQALIQVYPSEYVRGILLVNNNIPGLMKDENNGKEDMNLELGVI